MIPQYSSIPLGTKIASHYESAKKLRNREMVAPRMAIVYPSYGCNFRCYGCISNAENAKPSMIDEDIFRSFIYQFTEMGGQSIEFSGGGEPTLHPQFYHLQKTIAFSGLKFGMITNGSGGKKNHDLFTTDLDISYIRVSLYKTTQLESIKDLVATRNQYLHSKAKIGAKLLIGNTDIPSMIYMTEQALETGVDSVSIKAKRHCNDDPEQLNDHDKHDLQAKLTYLKMKYPGKVFGDFVKTHQVGACWLSPLHTVIDAEGTVWICCYYQDRVEDISLGNLHQQSFKDIWYSPKHFEVMDQVHIDECSYFDCRYHEYNQIMAQELDNDTNHLAFL